MIPYLIPLIAAFLHPDFLGIWFYPIFALAFVATVPCIVRTFLRR